MNTASILAPDHPKTLHVVRSLRAALHMRAIRNSAREYMTHNTAHIGLIQQAMWFYQVYSPAYRRKEMLGYVLYVPQPVAYGLVRKEYGRWWVSGAVVPEARGRGYGGHLFAGLTAAANYFADTVWLEVRRTNLTALNVYRRLGYEIVGTRDDLPVPPSEILVMRYHRVKGRLISHGV